MFSFRKKTDLDAIESRINNFPDWLPPVLVKELRQGLRTRGFAIALIASQSILFLVLIGSIVSDSPQAAGQMINSAIFLVFGILTIIIQPLRGITAVTADIKAKTLELMQLTRMNSSRVVMGKWISLYSQTLLFGITIIPYFLLRYFFGGMDIEGTVGAFLGLLVLSGFLSAISVGLSANKSVIIRGLFVLFGFFGILSLSGGYASFFFLRGSMSGGPFFFGGWGMLWLALAAGSYISYLFLELGASIIAPISENRQTRLRLTSFAFLATCGLLCWAFNIKFSPFLSIAIMLATGFLFLSSYLFVTPNSSNKFLNKGVLGKAFGRILYPGWPAGFIAFLVMSIGLIGLSTITHGISRGEELFALLCVLSTLSLALILVELITPKTFSRFAFLMIMVICQVFILFLVTILSSVLSADEILLFASLIPVCQLLAISEYDFETVKISGYIINSTYLLIATFLAARRFDYYREIENSLQGKISS